MGKTRSTCFLVAHELAANGATETPAFADNGGFPVQRSQVGARPQAKVRDRVESVLTEAPGRAVHLI